jgi:hypothetical protein
MRVAEARDKFLPHVAAIISRKDICRVAFCRASVIFLKKTPDNIGATLALIFARRRRKEYHDAASVLP